MDGRFCMERIAFSELKTLVLLEQPFENFNRNLFPRRVDDYFRSAHSLGSIFAVFVGTTFIESHLGFNSLTDAPAITMCEVHQDNQHISDLDLSS